MQIDGSSIQLIERDSARRYDESDMMISLRESEDQTEIINIDDHREQLVDEFVKASLGRLRRRKLRRTTYANHKILKTKKA